MYRPQSPPMPHVFCPVDSRAARARLCAQCCRGVVVVCVCCKGEWLLCLGPNVAFGTEAQFTYFGCVCLCSLLPLWAVLLHSVLIPPTHPRHLLAFDCIRIHLLCKRH